MKGFLDPVKNAKAIGILIIIGSLLAIGSLLVVLGGFLGFGFSLFSPAGLIVIGIGITHLASLLSGVGLYRGEKWAIYLLGITGILGLIIYFVGNQGDIIYVGIQLVLFVWFYTAIDRFGNTKGNSDSVDTSTKSESVAS